jgi:uncharacterized protein (DUF362 family)
MTSDRLVLNEPFIDYDTTVNRCMDAAGAKGLFKGGRPIMLKPNLVNDSPHPITTAPSMCAAVIAFVKKHSDAPIVIAEGCGAAHLETPEVFERLGYDHLAEQHDVTLLDLNQAPLIKVKDVKFFSFFICTSVGKVPHESIVPVFVG